MPRIRKIVSVLICVIMILALFTPFSVSAVYANTLNQVSDIIYDNLCAKNTDFTISYTGSGLNETSAPSLLKEAISQSFRNMFYVQKYSYRVTPTALNVKLEYKADNGYPYIYASDYDQLKTVMERAVSENLEGLNIYLNQKIYDDDPEAISQKIMDVYKEARQNPIDDYSMYNVTKIGISVSSAKHLSPRSGEYIATVTFSYSQTKQEEEKLSVFVKESVASLHIDDKSDLEKVKAVNDFIKNYASYSITGSSEDFTAYGLYKNKTAVCQGYAMLASRMLWEAGVRNRLVTGTAVDQNTGQNGDHMWNAVCIEGEWLYLDVTWNDVYKNKNPYLALSEKEISADHFFDTEIYRFDHLERYTLAYLDKINHVAKLTIGQPRMEIGGTAVPIDEISENTVPVIIKDRTHLPIRAVIENLGGIVVWDANNRQITINYGSYILDMWVGSTTVMLNGITQTIETPPVIINNRTMVPLRMVAEFLGMGVDWDGQNRLVTITAK